MRISTKFKGKTYGWMTLQIENFLTLEGMGNCKSDEVQRVKCESFPRYVIYLSYLYCSFELLAETFSPLIVSARASIHLAASLL